MLHICKAIHFLVALAMNLTMFDSEFMCYTELEEYAKVLVCSPKSQGLSIKTKRGVQKICIDCYMITHQQQVVR
mgnify:CR=1 FL=1